MRPFLMLALLALGTPALADVAPSPCGRSNVIGQVVGAAAFGLLLGPATFGDDFEVRVNAGGGASYRTNITTFDRRPPEVLPQVAPRERMSLDALRATLPSVDWSAMARRRLGSSRFHYRAWTVSHLVVGGCNDALESSTRITAGFSVEALRTDLFQLELGAGPLFALAVAGHDPQGGRAMFGAAPFVRLGIDDPSQSVAAEAVLFYLFQPGVLEGLFHGGQLDITFLMRFPALTLTVTGRGEINHSQFGLAGTVLMVSGSVLIGARVPRG
jgi:hypothetical protein